MSNLHLRRQHDSTVAAVASIILFTPMPRLEPKVQSRRRTS